MTNKVIIYSIFFIIILKITAIYITDLGLYGDEAQYWLWSQNLDFGYYSKPPLLAWFLRGYTDVFGSSFVSLKTFPILIIELNIHYTGNPLETPSLFRILNTQDTGNFFRVVLVI